MISTPWGAMRPGTAKPSSSFTGAGGSAVGGNASASAGAGAGANASGRQAGQRADSSAMRQAAEARHRWGSGQRLGGEGL